MLTPIRATLDRSLTILAADTHFGGLVGKCAFDFVPPSQHPLLQSLARDLFDRCKMVSSALPISVKSRHRTRRWYARAAPICRAGCAIAAFVHLLPPGHSAPADWESVDVDAWQRQLAFRELLPILRRINAKLLPAIGAPPWMSEFNPTAFRRDPSNPLLRPDRRR